MSAQSSLSGRQTTAKTHGMPELGVSAIAIWKIKPPVNDVSITVVGHDGEYYALGQGSGTEKQRAKDMAARSAIEWLRSQYSSEVDFGGV